MCYKIGNCFNPYKILRNINKIFLLSNQPGEILQNVNLLISKFENAFIESYCVVLKLNTITKTIKNRKKHTINVIASA